MAPGFLSKFVKGNAAAATTNNRERSDSPRSSGTRSSTSTLPADDVSSSTSKQSSIDMASPTRPPFATINTILRPRKTSLSSTSSSQPNVIVVPPSPLSVNGSLSSDNNFADGSDRQNDVNSTDKSAGELTSLGGTTSVTAFRSVDDITPTPTPTTPRPPPRTSPKRNSRANPLSPSSSTPNIPLIDPKQTNANPSPAMPRALDTPPFEVRRSTSNRSLNVNVNHARAATSPETTRDIGQGEGSNVISMAPIVESPTALRSPEFPSLHYSSPSEPGNGNASLLPPRDSDAVSLVSTTTNNSTKEKKRPWRKSTTRKPTGLAGAIAASGMAMAHPTLSAAQQASFSPVVVQAHQHNTPSPRKGSISGSHPYTRSPTGSANHVKGRSSDLSPKHAKSKRPSSARSGARRTSISNHSDNTSEQFPEERVDYYSGLDGSSDEDDDSGSSDLMGLDLEMDDIPVTGFAVASNKRNADFHELFPGIPEGDYLIEGQYPPVDQSRGK